MDRRSHTLESSGDQPEFSTRKTTPKKMHQEAYSSTVEHSTSCQMKDCGGSHSISLCDCFKQLGPREKEAVARKLKLCMRVVVQLPHFQPEASHITALWSSSRAAKWCNKWCNIQWSLCACFNSNGWHESCSRKDIDVSSHVGLKHPSSQRKQHQTSTSPVQQLMWRSHILMDGGKQQTSQSILWFVLKNCQFQL